MSSVVEPGVVPVRPTPVAARRSVSMGDVARLAGVSAQTVSRVANGAANVDAATREKVLVAMRELGYRPNSAARSLKRGAFHSIGVIVFALSTYGSSRTLDGLAQAASAAGYSLTLMPVEGSNTPDNVNRAFAALAEQAVDGVIIEIEAHRMDEVEIVIPEWMPVVVIASRERSDRPAIDADQATGARLVMEHLFELGHTRIAHVAGPADAYSAIQRELGWRGALEARGLEPAQMVRGDWTPESGYEIGCRLAAQPDELPTAIFAANDQMALGLMRALHEHGIDIPSRVSVAGFDDMPESANFWPPLTTIRQDFTGLGVRSVATLLDEMSRPHPRPGFEVVPVELVVRASTARAPF